MGARKRIVRHFTTTCDINYLSQGLALYHSLMRVNPDFHLFWLCVDDKCYDALKKLDYVNITLHKAAPLFPGNGFSHKEYCWSLASRYTWWILKQYDFESIAYLDADLYFYQDYEHIFKEIGDKSIGLVEHRIPTYEKVGKYNVGFIYFRNDVAGRECLNSWQRLVGDKGNEYFEEYGSCGDQKYLEIFEQWHPLKVHIIESGHMAWWNSRYYDFKGDSIVYNGERQLLIYAHYSHFKLTGSGYTHDEMIPLEDVKWRRLKQYYDQYAKEVRKWRS